MSPDLAGLDQAAIIPLTMETDAKRLSRERFGKYAANYVASRTHAAGADIDRIVELVGEHPDWEALDIATGGGHTALAVAPHVAHVVATDLTAAMLAAAQEFIVSQGAENVDFQLADAEALPFPPGSFDLVTCRIAPHHFPHPERFVAEVARVLRPGGLFVLQDQIVPEDKAAADYITDIERRRDPSHQRALSVEEWKRLLAGAGLALETAESFEKQPRLERWVADQEGSAQDLADLRRLLSQAPPVVQEWTHPKDLDGPEATFVIRHGVFSARKPGNPPSL